MKILRKCTFIDDTISAIEFLTELKAKQIEDSYHWIGANGFRMDAQDTIEYISNKAVTQKYVTVRHYEDNRRVCVELGLSGRNNLFIDLK